MNADIILLKYGEISLKGLNRPVFEKKLMSNINRALAPLGKFSVKRSQSTVYVEPLSDDIDMEETVERLSKVFGIVNICPAVKCEKTMEAIEKTTVAALNQMDLEGKTFKVEAKREDKQFPMNSPQICQHMGGVILKNTNGLTGDVHNPDSTAGKATLLLSGGIDSPVAGWMISKRGAALEAVHFHSHPYTSDRAKEKVIDLAKIISEYTGEIKLHIVPFTDIQLDIIDKCPKEYLTIIMRRLMMQIAERISIESGSQALITGESIGQVASQTMESLAVTDNAVNIPVFRPCIGMDKEEIVTISKKIDTYETSILPYEDCCTIFVPKHPKTKPSIPEIVEAEQLLTDPEGMMNKAIEEREILIIK